MGREELSDRIFKKGDDLIGILSDVNEGINFIDYLSKPTSVKDNKHKARKNLSFASKFVHYACFYFFEKDDAKRDNFSIYDSVLKKALPIYIKKYNLGNYNLNSYASYHKCIGDIIKESKESISRNGFDHLIWYYFKGRLESI